MSTPGLVSLLVSSEIQLNWFSSRAEIADAAFAPVKSVRGNTRRGCRRRILRPGSVFSTIHFLSLSLSSRGDEHVRVEATPSDLRPMVIPWSICN